MYKLKGLDRLFILGIVFLLVVVLWPQKSFAQQTRCCIIGPGNCFQMDPDLADCPGTSYVGSCGDFSICSQSPQAAVGCCVCPSQTPGETGGWCHPASQEGAPCGDMPCTQNEEVCTEIEQCILWAQSDKPEGEKSVLVSFIPSVTIPGSKYFNKGEPVILTGSTLGEYISAIYVFFVGVAGILATVMMMWGGVRYVVSFGNPQKIAAAKDTIVSALLGLAIALGSYVILLMINPNLVQFKGLAVGKFAPIPQNEVLGSSMKGATAVTWNGRNVDTYDQLLTDKARQYGIDRDWLKALMLVESGGEAGVVSSAGACGLIQLLPSTAQQYNPNVSCETLKNPETNITIAAQFYKDLLYNTCPQRAEYKNGKPVDCYPEKTQCQNGSHKYANAAYNGGQGGNCSSVSCLGQTWWECEKNAGYAETRAYVQKVQSAYDKIQSDPSFTWTAS